MATKSRLGVGGAWSFALGGSSRRIFVSEEPQLPGIRAANNRRGYK